MTDDFMRYLSGQKLYGDDFTQEQIDDWLADEAEGYADLKAREGTHYNYEYHQLNEIHAFNLLKKRRFEKALGIGSAYGDEFIPIARNIGEITIVDPSDAFAGVKDILGTPCAYRKPTRNGRIAFDSDYFDLITCLGAMHHIPNVSYVFGECYRCLSSGGVMVVREPITSMGDWRRPRPGVTRRERGIPEPLLEKIIGDVGFIIVRRALCQFPLVPKLAQIIGVSAYSNSILTHLDALFSRAFSWNTRYHRTSVWDKVAPTSIYYVLAK